MINLCSYIGNSVVIVVVVVRKI